MGTFIKNRGMVFRWYYGGALTTITQVERIKPHTGETEDIKVTFLEATESELAGSGVPNAGDVELTLVYDPANAGHAALLASWVAGVVEAGGTEQAAILYADTNALLFKYTKALVKKFEFVEGVHNTVQKVNVTIAVSGVTVTP